MIRVISIVLWLPALALAQIEAPGSPEHVAQWLSLLSATSTPSGITASEYLLSRVTFNSGDGGGQVDASGNGNNWTQTTASAKCTVANGYGSFDGGDYLSSVSTSLGNGLTEISCSVWILASSLAAYTGMLSQRDANINGIKQVLAASYRVAGYVEDSAGVQWSVPSTYTGAWHCVGMTWATSDDTGLLYWDGGCVATNMSLSAASLSVSAPWMIGSDGAIAGRYFRGLMDEARIYNRRLSAAQMLAIYNEGRP